MEKLFVILFYLKTYPTFDVLVHRKFVLRGKNRSTIYDFSGEKLRAKKYLVELSGEERKE